MAQERGLLDDDEARVNEAIEGSFPASDPPPWTLGVKPRSRDLALPSEIDVPKPAPPLKDR